MYSEELTQFIENNRLKYNVNKLCEMIYDKFNKKITTKALRKYYYRHNLKYKKQLCRRWNCTLSKPIGSESNPDKNGLIRIKVTDKQWMYKQRYIYEQHHGKIPKGYRVVFLNGDNTDFSIDNLGIVRNKDAIVAFSHKLTSSDREITKLGLQVAHLINKTKEKQEEN